MSIAKYRKKLLNAEKRKRRIIAQLLDIRMLLRGSLVRVHTKCGKDNCWCKDQKGHPHTRITWSEKGRTITRKVPPRYIAWVQGMIRNFHRFRSLRRKLNELQTETKTILDDLEKELIDKTRNYQDTLTTKSKIGTK